MKVVVPSVPLTAGFIGKFVVFSAAMGSGMAGLVVIAMLATVITAFFYLRLIVMMYMSDPPEGAALEPAGDVSRPFRLDPATGLALGVAVLATLVMGVLPGAFIDFAKHATLLF